MKAFPSNKPQTNDHILRHAREMRRKPTDAEEKLWWMLRARRLGGYKFRRQHPVGPYIVDFYCDERKLAVEIDGGQHDEDAARREDQVRTEYLMSKGIRVVRFWSDEALRDTDLVCEAILKTLEGDASCTPPHPNPLPEGEGTRGTGDVK